VRSLDAIAVRSLVAITIVLAATGDAARADKPKLAALAPAADARRAVPIGPAGQVYEPDGKGAWVRRQAGGITETIVSASAAGNTVIAGAKSSPPFKLKAGAWTALHLGLKAKALVGSGSRVLAAVGKTVFALDRSQPIKLADAPDPVTALAASPSGVVIATDKGLLKLQGAAFKPIKKGPKKVRALVSDRWALVDRGALDLKTMKPIVWPAGVNIVEATTLGADLVGVSMAGKTVELVTIKAGKVEREKVPVDDPKPVVGVVVDKRKRVAIALRDGRIALRDEGAWTVSEVRDELPADKPGPAPAESK
jgi:hypothetical protein